jgi:hypothetical protein
MLRKVLSNNLLRINRFRGGREILSLWQMPWDNLAKIDNEGLCQSPFLGGSDRVRLTAGRTGSGEKEKERDEAESEYLDRGRL